MGIKILNVYGQSESSALGTFWTRDDYARFDFKAQFGSIGRIRGNEMRITNPDSEGRGEIELRGRNVMMGYLNNPSKTKGAFSDDGWLLTGDQGMIDEDGFVFLTGRIKEIMKDMGGEMILPVQVEEGVKKACNKPLKTIINEVIVVGDGEYFISALLTLMEKKPEGNPSGQLEGYAKEVDPAAQTVAQAKTSELWAKELETCIGEYNKVAAKSQERVFRYYILPKDITPEDAPDMMTPTLKIKRTGVVAGYSEQIKACGGDKELTDRSIVPCTTD
jgi:long-subunit acyl-CoA synthetase (AMP-forming)